MRISVGSDERNETTQAVVEELRKRGIDVTLHGPLNDEPHEWAPVSEDVANQVAAGQADRGILFCWTGTGCSIAGAFLDTDDVDPTELANIERVKALDKR